MTYRELMLYILENGLEDEQVFEDGKPVGFYTIEEAAASFEVGVATVRVWIKLKMLPSIMLGNVVYIPEGAEPKGASWIDRDDGTKKYVESCINAL